MKSIKIVASIVALSCLLNIILSTQLRTQSQNRQAVPPAAVTKSIQTPNMPAPVAPAGPAPAMPGNQIGIMAAQNLTEVFSRLFTDPTRNSVVCPCKKSAEELNALKVNITADGSVWSAPRKKENYHEKKKHGWEASAYLFDYLDDVLQKKIVSEFDRIFKEAQKMPEPQGYKEPYSLDRLLGMNAGNAVPPKEELIKKITAISPGFNAAVWDTAITCGKMNSIVKQWNWYADSSQPDVGKYIVDRYDFDGDGRLNAREFIIAMIRNNKKVVEGVKKCKNCMEDVALNLIDPIYLYLDCSGNNMLTAEQMWNTLPKLKRSTMGYDLFKCQLEAGRYRTSSINDFILKSHGLTNGKLTREEFRLGVLMGYWDRQTDTSKIYLDDARNMKSMRWANNGNVDTVCERIKNSIERNRGF